MKFSLKHLATLFLLFACTTVHAQTTEITDSVSVRGNCGMCKKNIETAATEAGATYALWNRRTKVLQLRYDSSKTNLDKIEQKIADKGYDTEHKRGSDEAYEKLEACCHYERKEADTPKKTTPAPRGT